jgi:hypothetical protein
MFEDLEREGGLIGGMSNGVVGCGGEVVVYILKL